MSSGYKSFIHLCALNLQEPYSWHEYAMGMGIIGYLWGLDGALYIAQFCDLPILVNNLDRYTNHFLQAQLEVPTKLLVKAK
jgi:hypothetical protein